MSDRTDRRSGWLPRRGLAPLGQIYLGAAALHHGTYDRGWRRTERLSVPVISVGNITAGGTGKTPAVCWLAAHFDRIGLAVGLVSRGYGGTPSARPLIVSEGGGPVARPEEAGDEPVLLAARLPRTIVVVGRDRAGAARVAVAAGAQVIVMDDGYQHRRLSRDVDLLLLDAENPFDDGYGLPAGLLRERPSAIRRADIIILTRAPSRFLDASQPLATEDLPGSLADVLDRVPIAARPPVFAAEHADDGLAVPGGFIEPAEKLRDRRVLAVSGIARPTSFEETLRAHGAILLDHLAWPDHHRFGPADARSIKERGEQLGAEMIVTTEKDAVRWPREAPDPVVLRIALRVAAEARAVELVLKLAGIRAQAVT